MNRKDFLYSLVGIPFLLAGSRALPLFAGQYITYHTPVSLADTHVDLYRSLRSRNTKVPILLNFWARWCAPCKEELPSLEMLREKETSYDVVYFGIGEDKESSKTFFQKILQKHHDTKLVSSIDEASFFGGSIKTMQKFGLRSLPSTLFITEDLMVKAYYVGAYDWFKDKEQLL